MAATTKGDLGPAPIVRRAGLGGRWLAISVPESGLRIAVIGSNETDALREYRRREACWSLPLEERVT